MDRQTASKHLRDLMDKHGLKEWSIRITSDPKHTFLGMCSYRDQCIFINAFHIDTHPDPEVIDTFLHEIAHALVGPKNGHNPTWTTKAMGIGVNNLTACATIGLDPKIIDAVRSGATVEVTFEEHKIERNITVEETVYKPKYEVTRLQDRCPECGKVAKEKFSFETVDAKSGDIIKLITLECFHIMRKVIPRGTPFETMVSHDWKPEIKNCKHEWPTLEESKAARKKGITLPTNKCKNCHEFKLYKFQVIGALAAEAGLATQKGFGIFDDCGLGKTVQALAIPRFHPIEYSPFLVITKSVATFQWFKQSIRWLGPDYLPMIIRTGRDFLMPGLKAYIIPFDLIRRFSPEKKKDLIEKLGIKLVIIDECQQIKNPDSSRTQEVRKLVGHPTVKVLPLSATPWKNKGDELFPVLNMMDPIKFYSQQAFLDSHVEYYYHGNTRKMGGIKNPAKFREYISNLVIRREYNEVMDEFPDVNRMKLPVQLDELQQQEYDESVSDFVAWYNQYVIDGTEESINGMEILAKMSRMRHVTGLAKMPATLTFTEKFVDETERKLVIFVHHKDVGQLMYRALTNPDKATNPEWHELAQTIQKEGIKIFQYTSAHTGKPIGFQIQEDFNNAKRAIMVASTLACGEALDLQTCADTILHERQWNPQNEDQAAPGRFRRIGQESGVINITIPEAEGTVDEHLDGIVERKRGQFHAVMNKGEVPVWSENDIAKELAVIIVSKHKEKMKKLGREDRPRLQQGMAQI